jgi:hypothetical protein
VFFWCDFPNNKEAYKRIFAYILTLLGCILWGWIIVIFWGALGVIAPVILFAAFVISDIYKEDYYIKFILLLFVVLIGLFEFK